MDQHPQDQLLEVLAWLSPCLQEQNMWRMRTKMHLLSCTRPPRYTQFHVEPGTWSPGPE